MSKHDQTLPNVKNCNVSTAISHQSFCHPNPCYNGGTCSEAITGFSCACPSDYTGPFCKGKKDYANHSLKNDKLCLSVSLRASLGEPFWKVARERHARRDAKDDVLCRLASLAKSKFSLKLCFNFRLRRHEFWAQYFGPFNPLVWLHLVELGWSLKYAVRLISLFMTIINQNHPDQVNELNALNHKVQTSWFIIRFWETATYPSPKPTLTLTSHLG